MKLQVVFSGFGEMIDNIETDLVLPTLDITKTARIGLMFTIISLFLAGCGVKGDLIHPTQQNQTNEQPNKIETQQDSAPLKEQN